jgi:hypothetical protein
LCSLYLSLGVPNGLLLTSHQANFSGAIAGEKEDFCKGSLARTIFYFIFVFSLFYFCLHLFIKNTKKISSFIVAFTCLLLVLLEWVLLRIPSCVILLAPKNNDFICTPIAPPAPETNFYEIKPVLLNLVMKEQFSGVSSDDAAAHLNNFVELCEMQKYKDVDGNIIKLKLFPFSLRGRAKDWLLSLP